jgi:hypothetical protein
MGHSTGGYAGIHMSLVLNIKSGYAGMHLWSIFVCFPQSKNKNRGTNKNFDLPANKRKREVCEKAISMSELEAQNPINTRESDDFGCFDKLIRLTKAVIALLQNS